MEFTIREDDGYLISKDGCKTIPNKKGNRDFDRIQAYMDEGNEIKSGKITVPDDWQKPELIPDLVKEDEQPIE